jgi:CheY-like chemotaxis protein
MARNAIICVDDEKIILNSLKAQIKSYFGNKYIVEVAESADEAWEIIQDLLQNNIGILIIVSDWLMPKVKGDEFLISIHQKYPQIKKVLLTGHASQQAIDKLMDSAELQAVITKPWDEDELIKIIENGLD